VVHAGVGWLRRVKYFRKFVLKKLQKCDNFLFWYLVEWTETVTDWQWFSFFHTVHCTQVTGSILRQCAAFSTRKCDKINKKITNEKCLVVFTKFGENFLWNGISSILSGKQCFRWFVLLIYVSHKTGDYTKKLIQQTNASW